MLLDVFYLLKVIVATLFLIQACKLDLRERRVPNSVWKYMLAVFIPFNLIEFLMLKYNIFFVLIQFALIFVLSCFLYQIGAYGGADAKAFIALAVAFPIYPNISIFPLLNQGFGIFAFSTLSNSVVFAPLILVYMFFRNVMKEGLKPIKDNYFYLFYYFIGYRVDAEKIPPFHNLLEFFDGELTRVMKGREPDDRVLQKLKKARRNGKIEKVWVTPGLPFLIFVTIGFLTSAIFGDMLFEVLLRFLH